MSNTFIPPQSPESFSVAPPTTSADSSDSTPIYQRAASIGFIALLISMLANSDAVQNYISNGLMPLSEMITNATQDYSAAWLNVMNGPAGANVKGVPWDQLSDLGKIDADAQGQTDADHPGDPSTNSTDAKAAIQRDTTTFNVHNTQYNQMSTFYNGISSGLNDNISQTNSQVSFDYQQIQSNTFATQQTLVSVL